MLKNFIKVTLRSMARSRVNFASNIVGLANAREAEQLRALESLEQNPAWASPAAAEARDKQRVLKGLLIWSLDQDYRYRLWQQRKAVDDIERNLVAAAELSARTEQIRAEMPVRLAGFKQRIEALQPRIESLVGQIDQVLGNQQTELQAVVIDELRTRQQRLSSYRIQARFALATIYDQATVQSAGSSGGSE